MKTGLLLFILLRMLSAGDCYAQPGQVSPVSDSLVFCIRQLCYDSVKNSVCRQDVKPELLYDFTYQYPYYRIKDKQWRRGNQLQFEFSILPSHGFIYIFSLDGENTPNIQPAIRIDSLRKLPLVYPALLKGLTLETEGKQYISLWYSTDSIVNADKLMRGIELTMGPIVKRNNRQLGKRLLLPNNGWHFYATHFGFVIQPELYEVPERFVIPIIIEMNVIGKMGVRRVKSKKN